MAHMQQAASPAKKQESQPAQTSRKPLAKDDDKKTGTASSSVRSSGVSDARPTITSFASSSASSSHPNDINSCVNQIIRMYREFEVTIRHRSREFRDRDESTHKDLLSRISRAVRSLQSAKDRYVNEFGKILDVEDSTAIASLQQTISELKILLEELRTSPVAFDFDDLASPDFLHVMNMLGAGGESSTKALEDLIRRSEYRVAIVFVHILSLTLNPHDAFDLTPFRSQIGNWLALIASTVKTENSASSAADRMLRVAQIWSTLCKHYSGIVEELHVYMSHKHAFTRSERSMSWTVMSLRGSWVGTRTRSLCEQCILGQDQDDELKIISGCISRIRNVLMNSAAFNWLSDRLSATVRLTTGLTSTKICEAYTAFKLVSQEKVSVRLDLQWDPFGFLQDYYGETRIYGLANVLTLNGDAECCQMLKCRDYMQQTWRVGSARTLKSIQKVLETSQRQTMSSGTAHTGKASLQFTFDKPRTLVKMTGSVFDLLDITEQLCWLAATCQTSSDGSLRMYDLSIGGHPDDGTPSITADICDDGVFENDEAKPNLCWLPLIGTASLVKGFPILRRQHHEPGLELSLDTMITFAGACSVNNFDSKVVMKSFSTLLVAMEKTETSTTWHCITKEDFGRVSYCESEALTPQPGLDETCLKSPRHFLGWSKMTTQELGTRNACYSGSTRPKADPRSGIKFALSSLSISAGKYVTAGASVNLSRHQAEFVARREAPLEVKVNELRKMFVMLYDDLTRRAWLVDGASAVLHLLRLRLVAAPYNTSTMFDIADFCYAADPGGPEMSVKALLKNRNHKLIEVREEFIEVSDSSAITKEKVTFWKAEDVILELWHLFEQMVDHQVNSRAVAGVELHATYRDTLEGWPLLDLAEGQPHFEAMAVELHASGRGWVDFVRDVRAITLLGRGFGDVIRTRPNSSEQCLYWTQVPPYEDYLTVRLELLRQICRSSSDTDTGAIKLSRNAHWHKAHCLFEHCDCVAASKRNCDRIQVLLPPMTIGAKRHPGVDVMSNDVYQQAAVIFGRSTFWKWRWGNKGDPVPDDGVAEDNTDNGIGLESEPQKTTPIQVKGSSSRSTKLPLRVFGKKQADVAGVTR